MSTALICILLLVVAVFGIKSYMKRLAYGCCGSGGKAPEKIKVKDKDPSHYPYRRIMKVDGMSCGNCAVRVENALNSLEGVWARVDLKTKEADIRMKQEYDDKILKEAVKGSGYTVLQLDPAN